MKKLVSMILALAMIISCFSCVAFADDEIKITLNGSYLTMDQNPIIVDGRTLVPLRVIFEGLGAKVSWDDATKTATGTKDGKEIKITIDNTVAKVDGKDVTLDVPAQIVNARTLVPVRFISESLGASVAWNGDTKTVTITSASSTPQSGVLFEENFDNKTSFAENKDFVVGGVYNAKFITLSSDVDHTTGKGKSIKLANRTKTDHRIKFVNAFDGAKKGDKFEITAWVYTTETTATKVRLGVFGDVGTKTAYTSPKYAIADVKANTWVELKLEYEYDNEEITQVGFDQAAGKDPLLASYYIDDVKVTKK